MSLHQVTNRISVIDSPLEGRARVLGTYLVRGERTAVIDPGPTSQVSVSMEVMGAHNITPDIVLLSHIHLDHGGGSWKLAEEYGCQVHCHPRGASHMVDPSKLKAGAERLFGEKVREYGEIKGVPDGMVRESVDGEILDLGGVTLEVLWTPGHSSHSQSFWEPDSRTVFVGDAVGHVIGEGGPVIPVSPPPHNPEKSEESIDRILALNADLLCIAHFGSHENPGKHLNKIKSRSRLWEKLSVEAAKESYSLDRFAELILEEDYELREHLKNTGSLVDAIKGSVLGFWMYGKWVLEQD